MDKRLAIRTLNWISRHRLNLR